LEITTNPFFREISNNDILLTKTVFSGSERISFAFLESLTGVNRVQRVMHEYPADIS
jgi:hypothetical protein